MNEKTKKSVYETLSKIDVKPYLSVKGSGSYRLSYLSWAKAWGLVKAIYPDASYQIKEYPNWVLTKDGTYQQAGTLDYRITSAGCEVEVTVTIDGVDYSQKLYPMDNRNKPIMKPTIAQINKSQQRCLVKALAIAGLGLSVYAGEDLPSNDDETTKHEERKSRTATQRKTAEPKKQAQSRELSKEQLREVHVKYGDQMITLGYLYDAVAKGNGKATDFASNLEGKVADAFTRLTILEGKG